MNAWKQNPAMLLKNNNSSFYSRSQKVPSLSGFKSRSGSITMDNAQEEIAAFRRGHISGDFPMLDLGSPMTPNESYSLLLKKVQPEAQSPSSSYGQLSGLRDRQTSLGKEYMVLPKSTEREPKIIITPVTERLEQIHMDSFSPRVSMARSSPFSASRGSVAKKLSVYLKKKMTGDLEETGSLDTSKHHMEDPLVRKNVNSARYRAGRSESGRFLAIIAKQAVMGRNAEISKVLHLALEKTNVDALKRAKKEQSLNKRRKFIRFVKHIVDQVLRITEPWKPDSLLVIMWKIFMMGVILLQAFFSTYIVCFLNNSELQFQSPIFLTDFIGDIFYLLEILSLFQIGYYYHGELCCERSDIVVHYLTGKFPLDLISMLSIVGRFLPNTNWEYLILLVLIRLYKIRPLLSAIEDYFQFSREASSVQRVIKLSGLMIILAHFCACGLYSITKWEDDADNWIVASNLTGKSEREIYVTSLYWSVTTMTTVGFGDIAPITMVERIFVVGVMIISSIIFGYILSTIGTLLLEISAFSSEAKEKIRILTKYMNEKGLPKDVQSKIRKYLEFYLDRENTAKIEGDFIMKMLSPNLQEEIVREVNAKTIIDCYIFSSNFRKKFLYLVSKDLTERSYGPDETVFLRNDHLDCSAYFITSGKIDLCYERCAISLQKLKKGACFGFLSFFSGKPREISAKSLEFTTLFELKREKFLEKLEHFASEKETYFMIKDSIILYNTNQYLDIKCFSCGSPSHIIAACPSLHFTLDAQEVIKEYREEEVRFRKHFVRTKRRKFHALKSLELLQESASQIQMGHQTEVDNEFDENDQLGTYCGSYSSIDEILDRKIYDPKPLDYVADTTHMKYLDVADGFKLTSVPTLNQITGSKRSRQKVGEIETFMKNHYDVYHHNLNIDRVKNFEVYYPMNNITKLIVEFEKVRLEKIVQMRLGFAAKHLSPLLVKSFRMNEKKNSIPTSTPVAPLTKLPSIKQKTIKRHSVNIPRRDSISANPSDILLYNNSETKASSSITRFRHKSILGTSSLTPPYLIPPGDLKKRFEPLDFSQKVGKFREKDLSTIREDNTDKMEKGSQSNLSIGTPQANKTLMPLDIKFAQAESLLSRIESRIAGVDASTEIRSSGKEHNKIADSLGPSKSELLNSRLKVDSHFRHMASGSASSTSSLEAEPSAGTSNNVDYSKLIQKFPNKPQGLKVKTEHSHRQARSGRMPDKNILSENDQKSMQDLKNDTNRIFRVLMLDRLCETEGSHKRATSEDNAKEAKKVMEKYRLPQLFKKLTSNNDDEDDQTSNLSLKSQNY